MSLLNGSPTWMYNAGGDFYPYLLNQSLRFNSADSAYLSRTPSSASNRKTFTLSCWVKRAKLGEQTILDAYSNDQNRTRLMIDAGNRFQVFTRLSNSDHNLICNARSRDTLSWYHVVYSIDTTQSTASNRAKIYINGALQTFTGSNFPDQNEDMFINSNVGHSIGCANDGGGRETFFDGYLSEMHLVDGSALTASSFGETKEGIWIPKEYTGSHGTNGFYLPFDDGSAIGDDESANTNDFTVNNLVANDIVTDSPTSNFCTLNPLTIGTHPTLSEGNLKIATTYSADIAGVASTWFMSSGKWYWEVHNEGATSTYPYLGITDQRQVLQNVTTSTYYTVAWHRQGTAAAQSGANTYMGTITKNNVTSWTNNDIIMFALDADARKLWVGKNGTWDGGGDPVAGSGEDASWTVNTAVSPVHMGYNGQGLGCVFNFGQDGTFAGNQTAQGNADGNGVGNFFYAPPTDYLAMSTSNLPAPGIDPNDGENPTDYFNTILWTGNGSNNRNITGIGFNPDFTWFKARSNGNSQGLVDTVRGNSNPNTLSSNSTAAEFDWTGIFKGHISDGFTAGTDSAINSNGETYVAWNWKAGGSAVTNNDGTLTSQVSANTDSGFSVVTYSGSNSAGSFGHGLNQAPDFVIIKQRNDTGFWAVGADINGWTWSSDFLQLQSTAAKATNGGTTIFTSAPTSTVVNIGGGSVTSTSGKNLVAYCFHNVEGYQKVGTYVGNGSADGPFVHIGFRPAWILIKRLEASTNGWYIYDNKRENYGTLVDAMLYANLANAEDNGSRDLDFLSNGFKPRLTDSNVNASGGSYVYLAIADQPEKYANAK